MLKRYAGILKRYIINLGINQKFMLSLFMLLIIPMILLLIVFNGFINAKINKKICETNLEILMQTEPGIQNFIDRMKFLSLSIGTNQDVQDLIRLYNEDADPKVKEMKLVDAQFRISMELMEYEYVQNISIFNHKDIIYQYGDYLLEEDRQFVSLLDELAGLPMWTRDSEGIYASRRTNVNQIHIMRAIKDVYTFQVIAYERITINEQYLRNQYMGILNDNNYIMILDEQGKVISSSDSGLLRKTWEEIGIRALPKANEGYILADGSVISWYKIAETNWTVVKVDNVSWLFRNNGLGRTMILVCIFFTVVFGIVFMMIQRQTLILPIVSMSKETKNLKNENFKNENYEISIVTDSTNEIGELNRNLAHMVKYIQDLILNQYEAQIKRREIELKYMQSQINPHFLYNTLDSIRWMAVLEKQDRIAEQIEALSNMFRHALSSGKEIVDLGQEIEHLRSYILIQEIRFGDRIRFDIQVQEELKCCQVLKLILQPIVENAVVHGLGDKTEGGTIRISVNRNEDTLHYCVEDDGLGADEAQVRRDMETKECYNGFALKNINERIQLKYGRQYGVEFHSVLMKGTRVDVRLPVIWEKSG